MELSKNISLKKQYFHYAIPSIMAMWVFSIYTLVDGFFVARYVGSQALAAVNIAMPFVNTIFALAIIFGVGTSTVVGILLGQGNNKKACQIFSFTSIMLLFFALLIVLSSLIGLNQIVRLLGGGGQLFDAVSSYIFIILWFAPFFMISYHFEILVKIDGFPRLATLGVFSSAIANILLDYLFVGIMDKGITGAALATGLAQILSTLVFLIHFLKKKGNIGFVKFSWNFKALLHILPLGIGDLISEFSTGFIVFIHNRFLLIMLGATSLISYTVISYMNMLVAMTMTGLTQGMQPLMSYYFGAGDKKNCKKLLNYAAISITILSLISIILVISLAGSISKLFINDNFALISVTASALKKYSLSFIFLGYNLLMVGFFASIGKAKEAIIISICRGFIFISLALYVIYLVNSNNLLWYASAISEFITFVAMVNFYWKSKFHID